jgi:hypothetical protein
MYLHLPTRDRNVVELQILLSEEMKRKRLKMPTRARSWRKPEPTHHMLPSVFSRVISLGDRGRKGRQARS